MYATVIFWLRPVSAFATGFAVDWLHARNSSGRFLSLVTLLSLGAASQLLLAFSGAGSFGLVFAIMILSASLAYALRAVYFSIFGDLKVPTHLIGTITGIVSFVGFMPDIFFGYVTGRMIDAYPGPLGFQLAFLFAAAGLFLGAIASLILYRRARTDRDLA